MKRKIRKLLPILLIISIILPNSIFGVKTVFADTYTYVNVSLNQKVYHAGGEAPLRGTVFVFRSDEDCAYELILTKYDTSLGEYLGVSMNPMSLILCPFGITTNIPGKFTFYANKNLPVYISPYR
jgi:hypothetical protein